MHRAYQSYTPVNNVFLKQKWDQDVFQIHRRKVHAAKAVIDNCCPKVHRHLIVKLKKLQQESVRSAIIERDNRMLTDKMNQIMRTGGYTDSRNNYAIYSKSLNGAKHKRELVRVAEENNMMIKRLIDRDPNYPYKKHMEDWQESRLFLQNISKYPPPAFALWPVPTLPIDTCTNNSNVHYAYASTGYWL